jgi:hypothetical protein
MFSVNAVKVRIIIYLHIFVQDNHRGFCQTIQYGGDGAGGGGVYLIDSLNATVLLKSETALMIIHSIPFMVIYMRHFFAPHLSTRRALLGVGNLLSFVELTKQNIFVTYRDKIYLRNVL